MDRFLNELYITTIRAVEAHRVADQGSRLQSTCLLWYDCLGHPWKDLMHHILKTSHGHPFTKSLKLIHGNTLCKACSLGKLLTQPLSTKITYDHDVSSKNLRRYLWTYSTNMQTNKIFYGIGWCIVGHMFVCCSHAMLYLRNSWHKWLSLRLTTLLSD